MKFTEFQESTSGSRLRRLPATIPKPEEGNQPLCLPVSRVRLCEGWKGRDDAPSTERRARFSSNYLKIFCISYDVLHLRAPPVITDRASRFRCEQIRVSRPRPSRINDRSSRRWYRETYTLGEKLPRSSGDGKRRPSEELGAITC